MTLDRASITAVVLAGGRSSRFGSPKLEADLDGSTLLDHALRAVAGVAGEIVVAGAANEEQAPGQVTTLPSTVDGVRIRRVTDDEAFAGPLAGLDGAIRSVETDFAIVAGGDMPALVPVVLDAMLAWLAASPDVDAVALHDGSRRQVLPLALRVEPARVAATEALRSGDRSLAGFIDRLRCAELPAAAWRVLDPDARTLVDVDVPADLDDMRVGKIH